MFNIQEKEEAQDYPEEDEDDYNSESDEELPDYTPTPIQPLHPSNFTKLKSLIQSTTELIASHELELDLAGRQQLLESIPAVDLQRRVFLQMLVILSNRNLCYVPLLTTVLLQHSCFVQACNYVLNTVHIFVLVFF